MGSIANKTSRRSRWQCVGCVIRPCVRGQHTVIGETKYVYPMAGALVGLLFVNIDLGVHDVPIELLNVNVLDCTKFDSKMSLVTCCK